MSTVYVVSDVDYEDVKVVGVYDSIEKSKAAMSMFEANKIEEFHINHFTLYEPIPDGMSLYRISLYGYFFRDDIVVCSIQEMNHDFIANKGIDIYYETEGIRSFHDIVAENKDIATKIAIERHKEFVLA